MTFRSFLSPFLRCCLANSDKTDASEEFHRRPLIQPDPDGSQKNRETSMFFSCFCVAADNLRELNEKKKEQKVSDCPTEREKNPNGSVAPSNPDCRVVHHDGEKPHWPRGVVSARPLLTPGHFIKSHIETNYRLGSDLRPIASVSNGKPVIFTRRHPCQWVAPPSLACTCNQLTGRTEGPSQGQQGAR